MNLQEINRRLEILKAKKVPVMNKRVLRGGLRNLNQRREVRRYGNEIKRQIKSYQDKRILENQRLLETQTDGDFAVMSFNTTPVEKFNEPKRRRMRNAGAGWF